MKSVVKQLAAGKRNQTDDLAEVLDCALNRPQTIIELAACAAHDKANVAARAIWVIRKIVEIDPKLLARHKRIIFAKLTSSPHWEVRAELCHIIPKLSLTRRESLAAIAFFESCQGDTSKIVRTWSLHAMYEFSKSMANMKPRVLRMVSQALKSEVPSIRARARNIQEELECAA